MIGDLAMRLLQAIVAAQMSTASLPAEKTEAVTCLAQNLWFEARGSSAKDQIAIASVVLNRVANKHYPDDICEVVWQPKQFSWTHDGLSDRIVMANPIDRGAWKQVVQISIEAISGDLHDPTSGATHFHAVYVQPDWSSQMRRIMRIDDHIYYRPHGRRVPRAS